MIVSRKCAQDDRWPIDLVDSRKEHPIITHLDLASLSPALEQREPGLWFATQRQETIGR